MCVRRCVGARPWHAAAAQRERWLGARQCCTRAPVPPLHPPGMPACFSRRTSDPWGMKEAWAKVTDRQSMGSLPFRCCTRAHLCHLCHGLFVPPQMARAHALTPAVVTPLAPHACTHLGLGLVIIRDHAHTHAPAVRLRRVVKGGGAEVMHGALVRMHASRRDCSLELELGAS